MDEGRDPNPKHILFLRAADQARALGQSWCGPEHLLLAVLAPPMATAASRALHDAGVTHESVMSHHARGHATETAPARVATNPAFHSVMGVAEGLALAAGVELSDEHVLVALLCGSYIDTASYLRRAGTDRATLMSTLTKQHVSLPKPLPPPSRDVGPMGPRVYYPASEHHAVITAMKAHYPPGVVHWGFNVSRWRPGSHWVDAEHACDAAAVVREAVSDARAVVVVPFDEAVASEAARS